jgi:hypothetical protein
LGRLIWHIIEKRGVPEPVNVVTGSLTISRPIKKIEGVRNAGVDGQAFLKGLNCRGMSAVEATLMPMFSE